MRLIINTDGGARGNPGPAGIGFVVQKVDNDDHEIIKECGEYIGEATNNQAEYKALVKALEWVVETKNEKRKIKNERIASAEGLAMTAGGEKNVEGEILNQVQDDKENEQDDVGGEQDDKTSRQARRINFDEEIESIECRLDSELVVKQLNGEYKMKNEGLKPLYEKVCASVRLIEKPIVFKHIFRESNKLADKLVNEAIDRESNKLIS